MYRGFTSEELEKEYSPSSMVGGDITPYLTAYKTLSAEQRDLLTVRENLKFGPSETHLLDFFPAVDADAPLHVFIHGGYWQALSHRDSASMAGFVTQSGSAFATLNYTLAPDARLDQMAKECCDALVWLAKQRSELGFDATRITLSGHSAGAHLASLVASRFEEVLQIAGIEIKNLILISGIYDLEPIAETSVNDPLQLTPSEIEQLSPLAHVPTSAQKVSVLVAELDTAEFVRQSREYAEKLRKNGVNVSFELKQGMHHFDIILHAETFLV
ncbi:alpha/beta hydrolase [Aliiroseovarius sp. F20344]|uniref:alpha/beta hydrolase n=1 Tax=Aliiroseovarius sp. F20344 TaxID=2926414 RepID=UPI001FF39DA0|nr:alpha/beta hydrolase [Aliiroseovarius sp. F20344]MCK0141083.1 alpha/beta hydrolase [Aliiroseovarius sp. F20344]